MGTPGWQQIEASFATRFGYRSLYASNHFHDFLVGPSAWSSSFNSTNRRKAHSIFMTYFAGPVVLVCALGCRACDRPSIPRPAKSVYDVSSYCKYRTSLSGIDVRPPKTTPISIKKNVKTSSNLASSRGLEQTVFWTRHFPHIYIGPFATQPNDIHIFFAFASKKP